MGRRQNAVGRRQNAEGRKQSRNFGISASPHPRRLSPVSVSPCLRVSLSPCLRVSLSPGLPVPLLPSRFAFLFFKKALAIAFDPTFQIDGGFLKLIIVQQATS